MLIEVTAEDIANGRPNDPWCCPVASAMRRVTSNRWSVGSTTMTQITGEHKTVMLDNSIGRLIRGFDNRKQLEPFTIQLEGTYAYRSDG